MGRSEADRIERAVAGDENALVELLERHGPEVRRRLTIPPRWRSVLTKDDVMQQAYIEAFLHIHDFTPQRNDSFHAWLAAIAQNILRDAVDWLGAVKRGGNYRRIEVVASSSSSAGAMLALLGVDSTTPSRCARDNEMNDALRHALDQLPHHHREVVRLYDLQQRSAAEVAHALGCSLGAMYMRRRRAHWSLRRLLGGSRFTSGVA